MGKEFEIVSETDVDGTPQQVFDAATTGTAGWLWPMEVEPRLGGAGPWGSKVTAWDPPHHFANRMEGENGFFNQLDYRIEQRAGGKAWLRYVHSGIFFEDWDNQYEGARRHTAFYQHTLGQYVRYFAGRPAAFADVQGPEASNSPDGFRAVGNALGITSGTAIDSTVQVSVPGLDPFDAVVDYLDPDFIGLRSQDAMYRFFGRNAFGAVVGMTVHLFRPGADGGATGAAWQKWLNGLYA